MQAELGDEKSSSPPESAKDWNGPHDGANPLNWPKWKRLYHTLIPTSIAFLCPFGSSVYTPGLKQVMSEFAVSREVVLLPFVFYLLGLSFGPVMAAPLSETGRKVVYLSALPISAAFTLGAGFSPSIAPLIVCRFFAGLFSSPGLSIGTGTISDVWTPDKRAIPMSMFVSFTQVGPALGSVIGGFVTLERSWRWTQWVMLFGSALVIALTMGMSETYKSVILRKRAKALNIEGPPSPHANKSAMETIKSFATKTIVRPLHMMCTEPIVTLFDLYVAFNFGLLNAFFASFSWVFENVYGFGIGVTGLTYLGQLVGTFIGLGIMIWISIYRWPRQAAAKSQEGTKLEPEYRLLSAKIGAPCLPISLFWFGWTARSSVLWLSPVAAEALFACGNLLIFITASLYLTDCYGAQYGASAWSSNTFLRYLFAFIFPLFSVQMYEGPGPGWASSLLGFCTLALVPIPFAFDRYGKWLRSKSSYSSGE
ncbi:Putative major facilitator superfamily, MFS transporter superfamily [Septoria linicola]|uniref:Major facilitator superfamily, MFS transporter superfamily n=1 Tax=Septoria linicola TaxID=215465 RepID=A0A9Q9EPC2_9PEZI|nr:putative major facilitator superfamily, MFS transporter superfamily [Septoria linicola]USW56373.1 Putative major facilitator superfamily, MFS transporter superfamily [Septoria linicola]